MAEESLERASGVKIRATKGETIDAPGALGEAVSASESLGVCL